jgi:hypothetical protein
MLYIYVCMYVYIDRREIRNGPRTGTQTDRHTYYITYMHTNITLLLLLLLLSTSDYLYCVYLHHVYICLFITYYICLYICIHTCTYIGSGQCDMCSGPQLGAADGAVGRRRSPHGRVQVYICVYMCMCIDRCIDMYV